MARNVSSHQRNAGLDLHILVTLQHFFRRHWNNGMAMESVGPRAEHKQIASFKDEAALKDGFLGVFPIRLAKVQNP